MVERGHLLIAGPEPEPPAVDEYVEHVRTAAGGGPAAPPSRPCRRRALRRQHAGQDRLPPVALAVSRLDFHRRRLRECASARVRRPRRSGTTPDHRPARHRRTDLRPDRRGDPSGVRDLVARRVAAPAGAAGERLRDRPGRGHRRRYVVCATPPREVDRRAGAVARASGHSSPRRAGHRACARLQGAPRDTIRPGRRPRGRVRLFSGWFHPAGGRAAPCGPPRMLRDDLDRRLRSVHHDVHRVHDVDPKPEPVEVARRAAPGIVGPTTPRGPTRGSRPHAACGRGAHRPSTVVTGARAAPRCLPPPWRRRGA